MRFGDIVTIKLMFTTFAPYAEKSYTVTFDRPFKTVPDVFIQVHNTYFTSQPDNISTTGFTLWLYNITNANRNPQKYSYLAIEQ